MKPPYKGDWRVKEYKPYTEKLEDYIAVMEGQLDVLLAVIDGFEEHMAKKMIKFMPDSLGNEHYYGLNPYIRILGEWGKSNTNTWP